MNNPAEDIKNRAAVPAELSSGADKEKISKYLMAALPIWFGRRNIDESDREAFINTLEWHRRFAHYIPFTVCDSDLIEQPYPALVPFVLHLAEALDKIEKPLAIFIVATPQTAKNSWFARFPKLLRDLRQNKPPTFIYPVIMGGQDFSVLDPFESAGHFSPMETEAHKRGAVYLYYNSDAHRAGAKRLVEFINRVLGEDLQSDGFPNYPPEDIRKIAWSLNREDFNLDDSKIGARPKYGIVGGAPLFPF